jgi:hypothetical protein
VPRREASAAARPPRLGRGRSGPRPFLPAWTVRAVGAGLFLISCDGGRVGGPRPLFPKAMRPTGARRPSDGGGSRRPARKPTRDLKDWGEKMRHPASHFAGTEET